MHEVKREIIEVDASDKAVGRVATQVAKILMGKHKPSFERHIDLGDCVVIHHASKVKFTGKKLVQKDYMHHTNHPGGLKTISMKKVFDANPADVMKKAIIKMLPKNKLRIEMMKRLIINN
ncbi:MAG: 50S ribosomal protein L13 [Candidatus Magasanikbacteria bacterium]|nr:50S ribosomal protein L13 [Candidatus Magasanikbacteria bacterium]